MPERVCDQFIAGVRSEELKKRLMIEPPDRLSRPVLLEITSLWESTPEDFNFGEWISNRLPLLDSLTRWSKEGRLTLQERSIVGSCKIPI